MKKKRGAGFIVMAAGAVAGAAAQPAVESLPPPEKAQGDQGRLGVSANVEGFFPSVLGDDSSFDYAVGGGAQLSYAPLPFVEALARAGVYSLTLGSDESVLYTGGSAGLSFVARLFERLSVSASGFAGLGKAFYQGDEAGMYELGARLETSIRLSAALTVGITGGYERLARPGETFLEAVTAGVTLRLDPGETGARSGRVSIEKIKTQAIFPVFRSWYDAEPFGTVTVRNNEDGPIENVRVSFFAPEYMGGPRLCATLPRLEKGKTAVVPLYAVFDERVLALIENGSTTADIAVEYGYIGTRRTSTEPVKLSLHHRNAMSWEDDRRAAAFVSPTDPAVLWFSRYASSVVRDRMRTELPANLQYAIGIFESLKLYGLNYVIDPNSSYVDMSENAATVDYLQYPSQTLMYRGGDCDDMSILYCSLLESVGIKTAFLTIPGHIYMAFDLDMSEADARDQFFDPGLLIFRDGRAWAPVEITMVKEGFVKAWRVGAKEWIDNAAVGSAAMYPMAENWARYAPSGLQDASSRFDLPDEAKAMIAFDAAVDRFISREIEPIVGEYEKRLAARRTPEVLNDYGMAMARVGMLDAAWEHFAEAAKANYAYAWNNLATIAFVRKDYKLAYQYYAWTTTLAPGDPVAVLGMARAAYEMDRYADASTLYAGLKLEAPELAARFTYLESAYGGVGRAWSMADRLASSVWSKPGQVWKAEEPVAAPVVAAKPPEPPAAPAPLAAPAAVVEAAEAPAEEAKVDEPPAAIVEAAPESVEETKADEAPAAIVEAVPETTEETKADEAPAAVAAAAPEPEAAKAEEPQALAPAPAMPTPAATTSAPALPTATASRSESDKSAALAQLLSQAAVAPPPSVVVEAPKDADIAAKQREAAAAIASAAVVAPPAVVLAAPVDADIVAKQQEAAVAAITPPAPVAVVAPAVAAPVPEPARVETPVTVAAPPASVVVPPPEPARVETPVTVAAPPAAVVVPSPEPARVEAPVAVVAPAAVVVPPPEPARVEAPAASSVVVVPPPEPTRVEAPVAVVAPPAAVVVPPPEPARVEAPAASSVVVVPPPETARVETPVAVTAPVAVVPTPEQPVEAPAAVTEPAPAEETARAEPALPPPAESYSVSPMSRFVASDLRAGAPAFGKRLPEDADASGYVPLPVQAPAPPAFIDLSSSSIRSASGSWTRTATTAVQTDPKAYYAKLVIPMDASKGELAYDFTARAAGSGWVGFGMHIQGKGAWKLSYYGGGDSLLVWITSDPKAFGDAAPRLQVYRSSGETQMTMLSSTKIAGSAFDARAYRIAFDPDAGTLRVYVDGALSLDMAGFKDLGQPTYAALRALDLAEFSDVRIAPKGSSGVAALPNPESGQAAETTHD